MPYPSNSRRDEIRRAVAARERAEARIGSITTTVAVASVVTAGALAVTMPGPAHRTGPSARSCARLVRDTVRSPFLWLGTGSVRLGRAQPGHELVVDAGSGSPGSGGFSPSPPPTAGSGGAQGTSGGS